MSNSFSEPKVLWNEQNIQLSYELPHRIYDVAKYPLHSVNGSTILLYGHENGVRVLWKGGRPFKEPRVPDAGGKAKTNGSSNDAVMILDSDDDMSVPQAALFEDKPEFEDEEEESNPSKPYPPIIQHLDLNFGATVLHLDVPPVSMSILDAGHAPPMFKDKIVFAVACSDHLIRVIALPLTPPSPASKLRQEVQSSLTAGYVGNSLWGESVVELSGFSMYPDGVSMTFINAKAGRELAAMTNGRERTRSTSIPGPSGGEWQILVASHSRESTGLLLLHNIPVIETQKGGKAVYSLSRDYSLPSQTQYLPSPPIAISFNPSISSLQSTHILLADKSGACRIYDYQPPRTLKSSGNANLTASGNSQGVWLLTLYAGFQSNKLDNATAVPVSFTGNFGRKSIVDAKWVMAGKAIMVLLADGEWGIWDIEGVGPEVSKGGLTPQGVKGGALTTFSISGWIDGAPVKSNSSRASMSQPSTSRFAPMTPGTRKLVEPVLFSGRSGHRFTRGGISVARLLTTSTISILDECVVLWLEESYVVIPSLRSFWDAQSRRNKGVGSGNLFNGGNSTGRAIRLEGVNLRGERCCGIRQLSQKPPPPEFGLPTEILIIGEHRYIMMSNRDPKPYSSRRETVSRLETQIMAPGELDVMEIDQVLSQMDSNTPFAHTKGKGRLLT